jgi:uncharacterized protein (DUF433 family)
MTDFVPPLGIGYYTTAEASRLLQIPARNVRRWLGGYGYTSQDIRRFVAPLWQPELPAANDHIELSFRDLIELRFVQAFIDAGVGLKSIRNCLDYARALTNHSHPFSTRRFRTDGKTIFLESLRESGECDLLDLKRKQYAIHKVIERSFRDLDLQNGEVSSWRPYRGKDSIVLDPQRAFGQPIAAESGVPTVALADAVQAEGSVERAGRLFEVRPAVVRDAVRFEQGRKAA